MKLWAPIIVTLSAVRAADEPQIVPDVVYGHKDGLALTYDVIKLAKPSGAAMLWVQSDRFITGNPVRARLPRRST